MDSRQIVVADAQLDAHTAEVLAAVAATDKIVSDRGSCADTLRHFADAAERSGQRLIIVDARLHAEAGALANLLDAPDRSSAVLLAHRGDGSADVAVQVADGLLSDAGEPQWTAGVLIVAEEDCAAFARAARAQAHDIDRRNASDQPLPWPEALTALRSVTSVRAVAAEPFCASCSPMDLPDMSEDDRRLYATASTKDDPLVRLVLRPLSRLVTRRAVAANRSPEWLTGLGVGIGLVAAAVAMLPGQLAWIVAGLALVAASIVLLSDGEVARYHRRLDVRGARVHGLGVRVVEVAFVLGLAVGTGRLGPPSWLLATAALGCLAVAANAGASLAAAGDATPTYRPLRWLAVALALIIAGPGWGILASALGSLIVVGLYTARAMTRRVTVSGAARHNRFLVPPGSFVDAGLLVRLMSNAAGEGFSTVAGRALAGGLVAVCIGAMWAWQGSAWPMFLAVCGFVFAAAVALASPLRGEHAWAVPPLLRGVELAVLMVIASTVASTGRFAAAAAAAAIYLLTSETIDRWRYLQAPPPAWVPVIGGGFDGRILLIAAGGLVGALLATSAMYLVAVAAMGLWLVAVVRYPWRAGADGS